MGRNLAGHRSIGELLGGRLNRCERLSNRASLNVFADDEHSYLFPYAQLLFAETIPNPALEKNADAPPEKLLICFAVAEVTVLGSGLQAVARKIQKCDLNFVKAVDRRFAATLKTHVVAVEVKFTKQAI